MTDSGHQELDLWEKMAPLLEARGAVHDVDQDYFQQSAEMTEGEIFSVVVALLGGEKAFFAPKAVEGLGPDDSSVTDLLDNLLILLARGRLIFGEDDRPLFILPRGPEPNEEIKAQWPHLIEAAHRVLPRAWDKVFSEPVSTPVSFWTQSPVWI